MKKLGLLLALVIGIPVGAVLTVLICAIASLLWLIFLPWKLFDYIFKQSSVSLQTFEEFIFACYGLGGVCILIPLTALGDDTID